MALLIFTTTTPSVLLSSHSSQASAFPASLSSRFCNNHITLTPKSYAIGNIRAPFIFKRRDALIAQAAADVDSVGSDNPEPSPEKNEESVPVENLPLESKLQQKLEQKMKMKLAKKIRLRRKRLVRKRHLRKKGRWPPSKMKKNKNV
ncbi:50S ribosomal protein 5 alpha, chloroplastic-like [Solanum dulcamara]|uniref:50S ribosomal protein 5 alpha, chloroplastic-like n=1 Tax=Solanum dulcamara TaxID=45834 RepID=UPI0024869873|nr:50S ribosomal protein 5 alpha, chloroplastic-like [Solanum dulcamara]